MEETMEPWTASMPWLCPTLGVSPVPAEDDVRRSTDMVALTRLDTLDLVACGLLLFPLQWMTN